MHHNSSLKSVRYGFKGQALQRSLSRKRHLQARDARRAGIAEIRHKMGDHARCGEPRARTIICIVSFCRNATMESVKFTKCCELSALGRDGGIKPRLRRTAGV
jgi:hypothetical protein